MKRVLITGINSYIGNAFEAYCIDDDQIKCKKISLRDGAWKNDSFSQYDVVLHVAGLAHVDVTGADEATRKRYYEINRDLAIQVAQKAKEDGVKQFLYLSSMIVYGDSAPVGRKKELTQASVPGPSNFYGDSKWQGEQGVMALSQGDVFCVCAIRIPMVYGRDSKGNFPLLVKLSGITPIFPKIHNRRSMIYIENLCELLKQVCEKGYQGVLCPQNKEQWSTSQLVGYLAKLQHRKIYFISGTTWFWKLAGHAVRQVNKIFGSFCYEKQLSQNIPFDYCIYTVEESLRKTLGQSVVRNGPMVSVITPCFNSEQTIRTTMESVLVQTYQNIEYIIIDGASTDNTVEIAESYRTKLEERGIKYRVVSEPDQGIYDAMNKGVALSGGELIGIINSDDWYESQALQRVVETYQNQGFDMFYADLRIVKKDAHGKVTGEIIKKSRLRKPVVSRDWNHPTTFLTQKVYEKFRYKLESIHDDWDLVLRIRRAGLKIVVLNEVLANFTMGGVSNEKDFKKCICRGKARYQIYRNNGYSRWYMVECVLIEAVKWLLH